MKKIMRFGASLGFKILTSRGSLWLTRHKGKRIGSELLAKAKQQKSQLSLAVYTKNERALNFYQRADFTVVNEQLDETTGQVEVSDEVASKLKKKSQVQLEKK